jgi:CDP-diacylglycerol--glycerol-3-phosphate 3-phosphatidyltransferase
LYTPYSCYMSAMKNPAILPWSLLTLRLISGPILLFDALDGQTDLSFVALLDLAILSDILDGILARGAGVDTQFFRRTDRIVDSALFLFVAAAAWIAHQDLIMQSRALVFAMLVLWLLSQIPALIKFGRWPCVACCWGRALWLFARGPCLGDCSVDRDPQQP